MLKVKWPKVLNYYDLDQRPLISWIDLGNGTMFRIFAFFCHGGTKNPRPGLVVGIERVGSFFFHLGSFVTWTYVSEKLNLPLGDARAMADWINAQNILSDKECIQQGHYRRCYIEAVEPYLYGSENTLKPLAPEIISQENVKDG